jgi:hypothetical protein
MQKVFETKLTTAAAAELLRLSGERVRRLTDGWIEKDESGAIRLIDAVHGYIRFIKSRPTRSAAETRVREARAREIELRTAQRAGELCETEEAVAPVDEIFGGLRSELAGLPAMVTRDLSVRRDIEAGINSILNKTAAKLEEQARTLQADGEIASRSA